MKFNLYTIEHELGTIVLGSSLHSDCNDPRLDYPILFNAGDPRYFENIVYVTIDKHLEESKDRIKRYLSHNPDSTFSCICVGEPPAFCLEAKNCDIVWIDPNESRTGAFNSVQKVFQRFNTWERELDMIVERSGELSDLANASLKVFRNDICITDPFSRVLSHRVYRSNLFAREQTDLIQEGECLPKSMVFDGIEDERAGEDFTSSKPTFSTMKAFHCTILRSTVSISPGYALILSIHPNCQSVGPKDCAPTLVFATAIKRLYAAFDAAENGNSYISAHSTFKSLVQGKSVPDSDLVQCSITLGWNRDIDECVCFCIDFMPTMEIQDCCFMRPYASICSHIQSYLDCVAFVLDARIVVVANLSSAGMSKNDLYAKIGQFAEDYRLITGASEPYAGLRNLQDSYHQAFSALRMGYAGSQPLVRFGDHALDIGMNFIMKEIGPEHFCPRALVEIAQSNPSLYLVLETYLNGNCNSSVAAKQLRLQRSSFVYRLEKARKLLGLDLDDPDTRLLLLISLKLINLYGLDNMDCLAPPIPRQ